MSNCEQCIVRRTSSLKALNEIEIKVIQECKTTHTVKRGDQLFGEGEYLNGVFCIKTGTCKLTKLSPNGNEQIVKLISSGELLGQRCMISGEPANLSAVALADMVMCIIPKNGVMPLFNKNNGFSMDVMKNICSELKTADDHLVTMAQKPVKQRLAKTLVYLHDKFGIDEDGSLSITLSREELAGMVGTATESCIRMLSGFNKAGYIKLNGKKISVNREKLVTYV